MDPADRSTIVPRELAMFDDFSANWWEHTSLQNQNKIRVPEIIKGLVETGRISRETAKSEKPLAGVHILDVGCGGGFLTEPLAKLGAQVTGLDPSLKLIECAREHIKDQADIRDSVQYVHGTIEEWSETNQEKYDHVVAAEVLDHIQARDLFIESCVKALKPGGTMYVSTINRTIWAWSRMILYYEYIARCMPRGAHHWHMLVTPEEAKSWFEKSNCVVISLEGCYVQTDGVWVRTGDTSISYFMQAMKKYSAL